jgi:DNA-binding transcriptional ArsR family regulator
VFAALGDATRLELLSRLSDGERHSVTELTDGFDLSRQAVTKHLQVLSEAGLVNRKRIGRESRFAMQPEALADARTYLARVSAQWDEAIARLRAAVEK